VKTQQVRLGNKIEFRMPVKHFLPNNMLFKFFMFFLFYSQQQAAVSLISHIFHFQLK
jgi:hypothetical protein